MEGIIPAAMVGNYIIFFRNRDGGVDFPISNVSYKIISDLHLYQKHLANINLRDAIQIFIPYSTNKEISLTADEFLMEFDYVKNLKENTFIEINKRFFESYWNISGKEESWLTETLKRLKSENLILLESKVDIQGKKEYYEYLTKENEESRLIGLDDDFIEKFTPKFCKENKVTMEDVKKFLLNAVRKENKNVDEIKIIQILSKKNTFEFESEEMESKIKAQCNMEKERILKIIRSVDFLLSKDDIKSFSYCEKNLFENLICNKHVEETIKENESLEFAFQELEIFDRIKRQSY